MGQMNSCIYNRIWRVIISKICSQMGKSIKGLIHNLVKKVYFRKFSFRNAAALLACP